MCGIVGIAGGGGHNNAKKIVKMLNSLAHRGPDADGSYEDPGLVCLGHRRLSIIDLSESGRQPMKRGHFVITFNGEIYNYLEIKKEIGREKYVSSGDTEVLLGAYKKWGVDFLEKLNGIFAFAIWDERDKTLFCARDHLGVKPFYYAIKNDCFYFASEIKGLLAAGIKAIPNDKVIYDYLVRGYYQHSNETFFEGIYQLPPGHFLVWSGGNMRIEKYWNVVERTRKLSLSSKDFSARNFFDLFKESIGYQLRSDVPIGIQLSGGLDSSSLTAMINKLSGGQHNFNLYSFVYSGVDDCEKPFMISTAKKLRWNLEFLEVRPRDMIELMEEMVWSQDEPFPGLPTFGQYIIAKECRRQNIPVIIGGEGGDEIGCGYEYFIGALVVDLIKEKGADTALRELVSFGDMKPKGRVGGEHELLRLFLNSLSTYFLPGASQDASSFVEHNVLRKDFLDYNYKPAEFDTPFDSYAKNMQYRDIFHTKLPRVLHSVDRAAMAYGVEHRVPFLDYRLVELGLSMPAEQKLHNGHQRFFIREAMKHLLPKDVVWAPKRSVPSPQRDWFKGDLKPWVSSILSSRSFKNRLYFNQSEVLNSYNNYCKTVGTPQNSFHIWQWLHLEIWLRKYFD